MDPELYHHHHITYLEDLPYWLSLADECGGPILELGCGTGRVLTLLRSEGFQVFGLDLAPAMLSFLKQLDQNAPVWQADMTTLNLGQRFPLILLTCNTYSTLPAADRRVLLNRVFAHLVSGGCFAASLPNPADLAEMGDSDEDGVEEIFTLPETGTPVQVSSSWESASDTVTIFWHYDRLLPDGQAQRTTHPIRHQLDPVEAYIQEMEQAGFTVTARGEFYGDLYQPEADFLILEARKPAK
jgi:SAM-dependent methyltransferase